MKYVKLGNTGLDVSKICLGTMSFGDVDRNWGHSWVLNEADSEVIIKKSLDLGINFFDTANIYSYGSSEEFLGRALKKDAKREEYVVATKLYSAMHEGPNGFGLSRKAILEQFDASLKRLDLDYVDILYIHRWDYDTPIEETMRTLHDLVRSGKVLYLGASSMYAWQFAKAQHVAKMNGWTAFSVMQNHHNLLYREEEREMNPMCFDMGVALVPYSPLAAGRLTRPWDSDSKRFKEDTMAIRKYDSTKDNDMEIVKRVKEIADKYAVSAAQIAMAWLWAKGVCSPVVGVTKTAYLDDFVAALDVVLTSDDIDYLEAMYVAHATMGNR